MSWLVTLLALFSGFILIPTNAAEMGVTINFSIDVSRGTFLLDEKPFMFAAGALHYFRIPRAYWRHRLAAMRRAGLNTLHTSVEWSSHEPQLGRYQFDGNNDIVAFIKMAQEEGLWTIVRPGPYIGASRDMGGLPAWLLWQKGKEDNDETLFHYWSYIERYMKELLERLKPLLFMHGGPILLVEIENCMGPHIDQLSNLVANQLGAGAPVIQVELMSSQEKMSKERTVMHTLDELLGERSISRIKDRRDIISVASALGKRGPWINSNLYVGMPGVWGVSIWEDLSSAVMPIISLYMRRQVSFSIVMFHGGTNFGFTSGALEMPETGQFAPYITSNDMRAPMREDGSINELFTVEISPKLRYLPTSSNSTGTIMRASYGTLVLRPCACLLDEKTLEELPFQRITNWLNPYTFEELFQSSGFVLYRTMLNSTLYNAQLMASQVHDRVQIYVDKELKGIISRTSAVNTATLHGTVEQGQTLDLFVENQGRTHMLKVDPVKHYKGLTYTAAVLLENKLLTNWTMYGYPLDDVEWIHMFVDNLSEEYTASCTPILYKGEFIVPKDMNVPADTQLDMTGWRKGVLFVNGHNLGRYWPSMGPQVTLYLPGCFLHPAPTPNKIVVLELLSPHPKGTIESVAVPNLGHMSSDHTKVFLALIILPFVLITGFWLLNYLNSWIYLK